MRFKNFKNYPRINIPEFLSDYFSVISITDDVLC